MVCPTHMAKEALEHFLLNWSNGLQPSLSLTTNFDGSICIKSEVVSSPPRIAPHAFNNSYPSEQRCKKSGRNSRQRRKIRRSETFKKSECKNFAAVLEYDENKQDGPHEAELSRCEAQVDDQLSNTISSEVSQSLEKFKAADSLSDLEFGYGVSDILADIEANPSPHSSSSPTSKNSIDVLHEEDWSDIPIDQLSKAQFSKFMEEVKSILTFRPPEFKPLNDV